MQRQIKNEQKISWLECPWTVKCFHQIFHKQDCLPSIAGADLVEFNPQVETGRTAMTAAKLLKELAAKMLEL